MKPMLELSPRSVLPLTAPLARVPQFKPPCDPVDAMAAAALDALTCAVLIINRARHLQFANAAARDELSGGTHLRLRDGFVTAAQQDRHALCRAITAALDDAGREPGDHRFVLLTGEHGERRAAHLRPLATGARKCGEQQYSHVMLTLLAPAAIEVPHARAFADLHGLTPTEHQVLVKVVNGATLKAVGAALHIAPATVTTHLKHIFDKTGVRRQSELVALCLRALPPTLA